MGACSSKSVNDTITEPVKPEQIDTPVDATIVDATPDIAPTETPADAAPSDYAKPEAEVAVAEEPAAVAEEPIAEEAPAAAIQDVPPPEPTKSASLVDNSLRLFLRGTPH